MKKVTILLKIAIRDGESGVLEMYDFDKAHVMMSQESFGTSYAHITDGVFDEDTNTLHTYGCSLHIRFKERYRKTIARMDRIIEN